MNALIRSLLDARTPASRADRELDPCQPDRRQGDRPPWGRRGDRSRGIRSCRSRRWQRGATGLGGAAGLPGGFSGVALAPASMLLARPTNMGGSIESVAFAQKQQRRETGAFQSAR